MARDPIDKAIRYGVAGFALYTLYGMMASGAFGSGAQKFAAQLRSAWGDTPGKLIGLTDGGTGTVPPPPQQAGRVSTAPAPAAGWYPTSLVDLGQVPVDYNPATRELKQRSSWVALYAPGMSENRYNSGVFFDASGAQVQYLGGGQFRDAGGRIVAYTSVTGMV